MLKDSARSTGVGTLTSEERTGTSQRTSYAQAAASQHCYQLVSQRKENLAEKADFKRGPVPHEVQ